MIAVLKAPSFRSFDLLFSGRCLDQHHGRVKLGICHLTRRSGSEPKGSPSRIFVTTSNRCLGKARKGAKFLSTHQSHRDGQLAA